MKSDKSKLLTSVSCVGILLLAALPPGMAQMPGAGAPGAGVQGPIDITANEQEFAGDAVIARGNVRVVYKDSVILAPMATLYKDPSGNPARAIFSGHPRLTQGSSKIDAETLTFEIATQKILAQGNAHSEVESSSEDDSMKPIASTKNAPVEIANKTDDREDNEKPQPAATKSNTGSKKPASNKPVEHIITDADTQEYDSGSGRFEAIGNVRVKHGDIFVKSDKLQLVYGMTNKPETALFTGRVTATQNRNSTMADTITYSLSTKRLQATGNVKSKVIQEKKPEIKKAVPVAMLTPSAKATTKAISIDSAFAADADKPIFILSDSQDYCKDNGRVAAHGNVRFVYGDTVGIGPSIILTKNAEGKAEKVIFNGRSQITQTGRRWIANSIVYIIAEHKVIAQGNTKAMIIQGPPQFQPVVPTQDNSRLAERQNANRSLSATKVEKTQ